MAELRGPGFLLDAVIEQDRQGRLTRQICAKVAPQLADDLDSVVTELKVSKRRFIEAAIVDAVERAKAIMQAEGLFEAIDEYHGFNKEAA
jgi:hypothetical protein